jgi:hypothetical protein
MVIICENKVTKRNMWSYKKPIKWWMEDVRKNLRNLPLCPGIIRQENHGWCGCV